MFVLFSSMAAWLSILGGIATGMYGAYGLIVGEVVVESRSMGMSVYQADLQPGQFYGFVAFYLTCALIFIVLGVLTKKRPA